MNRLQGDKRIMFLLLLFGFVTGVSVSSAQAEADFEYELDAYYSNIAWVKGLDDQEVPVVPNLGELDIYQLLSKDVLLPSFLVLEISVNPMPIVGVYTRKNYPSLYGAQSSDANIVRAVTAGFDEPFAISLFAGNVVRFAPPKGMKTEGDDKGYVGMLLSVGTKHIQDSKLISDDWAELEWKIKGQRETKAQHLSWSLRTGAKFHANNDISDTVMLGVRRDRIDFLHNNDSFLNDIGFDYRLDMLQDNFHPARQQFIVDKHWYIKDKDLTLTLGFGLIWNGGARYLNDLAQEQQQWEFILRPNISF
ncbi:MAG: hypothetical protein R8M46_00580 [Ghiorsea sp.]